MNTQKQIPLAQHPDFLDFLKSSEKQVFVLKGSAGTGKTTQIKQIVDTIPNTFVITFTNKAASVLKKKGVNAYTIHTAMYKAVKTGKTKEVKKPDLDPKTNKQRKDKNGDGVYITENEDIYDYIFNPAALHDKKIVPKSIRLKDTICIIDEGSLVPSTLWFEIFNHFPGKILVCGDDKQLPPVEAEYDNLKAAGKCIDHLTPYYEWFMHVKEDHLLTTVYRQNEDSAVHTIISDICRSGGHYLYPYKAVDDKTLDGGLCRLVTKLDDPIFQQFVLTSDIVIAWQNVSCDWLNSFIRSRLFEKEYEQEPTKRNKLPRVGDKLFVDARYSCVNFTIDKGTDLIITKLDDDNIDYKNGVVNFVEVINGDGVSFTVTIRLDFVGIKSKAGISSLKVVYGYAITCHKSQGSEYRSVVVIDDLYDNREKWMYTAATRTNNLLVMFKFPNFANIVKAEIRK